MSLEKEQPRFVKSYDNSFNKNSIFIVVSFVCLLLRLCFVWKPCIRNYQSEYCWNCGKSFQTNAGNSETEMTVIFCYSRFVFKEINVSFINNWQSDKNCYGKGSKWWYLKSWNTKTSASNLQQDRRPRALLFLVFFRSMVCLYWVLLSATGSHVDPTVLRSWSLHTFMAWCDKNCSLSQR